MQQETACSPERLALLGDWSTHLQDKCSLSWIC